MNTSPLGQHVIVDLHGCDSQQLDDVQFLLSLFLEAVEVSGATVVGTQIKKFEPQGVSGIILVEESHFAFHTWPENNTICFDYFTCGSVDPNYAVDFVLRQLSHTSVVYRRQERGSSFEES